MLGQLLIGIMKDSVGWRATFLMLTVATGLSAVPVMFYMVNEYKEWQ